MGFDSRDPAVPQLRRPAVDTGQAETRGLIDRLNLCVRCASAQRRDGGGLCDACASPARRTGKLFGR